MPRGIVSWNLSPLTSIEKNKHVRSLIKKFLQCSDSQEVFSEIQILQHNPLDDAMILVKVANAF